MRVNRTESAGDTVRVLPKKIKPGKSENQKNTHMTMRSGLEHPTSNIVLHFTYRPRWVRKYKRTIVETVIKERTKKRVVCMSVRVMLCTRRENADAGMFSRCVLFPEKNEE